MNKAYLRGYAFERRVRLLFERCGWFVIRSSKSRFPDLIAIKNGRFVFVECKLNKYLSKDEKKKIKNIERITGGKVYVAFIRNHKIYFRRGENEAEEFEKFIKREAKKLRTRT